MVNTLHFNIIQLPDCISVEYWTGDGKDGSDVKNFSEPAEVISFFITKYVASLKPRDVAQPG